MERDPGLGDRSARLDLCSEFSYVLSSDSGIRPFSLRAVLLILLPPDLSVSVYPDLMIRFPPFPFNISFAPPASSLFFLLAFPFLVVFALVWGRKGALCPRDGGALIAGAFLCRTPG